MLGQCFDGHLPLGTIDFHKSGVVLETELDGFWQVTDGPLVPVGEIRTIPIRELSGGKVEPTLEGAWIRRPAVREWRR